MSGVIAWTRWTPEGRTIIYRCDEDGPYFERLVDDGRGLRVLRVPADAEELDIR